MTEWHSDRYLLTSRFVLCEEQSATMGMRESRKSGEGHLLRSARGFPIPILEVT